MGNAANYIRAKGGGLGDISAGLIRYLFDHDGFELHVALPQYDSKIRHMAHLTFREIDLLAPLLHRRGIHLVSDSAFSHLAEIYDESEGHPRVQRAEAFQRHIINHLLDELQPDVVHCNDWMTGLVPAAARAKGIKSLFTLHNIFTEYDTPQNIDRTGIDIRRFMDLLYFQDYPHDDTRTWEQNRVDFTASGLLAADIINTVSESFLAEIVDGAFEEIIPTALRTVIRDKHARGQALGILNAPSDIVDPRLAKHITPFTSDNVIAMKAKNKADFQERVGLAIEPAAPLFFWPSRLYEQKGPALLTAIVQRCVDNWGAQIAVVANGDPETVVEFKDLAKAAPGSITYRAFSEEVSELGKAAADFVLMPSLYEPCGLPQMEGPRFGTLPIARLTGGLKDSVFELDLAGGTGNGFTFVDFLPQALEAAMERAVQFLREDVELRQQTLRRVMGESWERFTLANTATAYTKIYERLIG